MTKARNIADLLDANGDVKSGSLDNVPAVDLTNLSASNLTSGTIPDARVSASAVSQHATSFDDNAIINDLSTLALRQASDGNRSAYNTNSQFVDVFQDATGITNLTNFFRNTSEFMSTVNETIGSQTDLTSQATAQTGFDTGNQAGTFPDFVRSDNGGNSGNWYLGGNSPQSKSPTPTKAFVIDLGGTYSLNGSEINFRSWSTMARINAHYYAFKNTSNTWEYLNGSSRGSASGTSSSSSNMSASNGDNIHGINVNTDANYVATQFAIIPQSYHNNGNQYMGISYVDVNGKPYSLSANATGSFESNAITAPSSTNKMGAIITYQDNAGTNALNTDIVLKLSADGGSNYTTATLTALPDFSTGIKMAKVNDLTIGTAGTSLKYKLEFANQANGSKEARIRGVSLQY